MKKERVIVGSDHAGFKVKEKVKKGLIESNFDVFDITPNYIEGDDYPKVAFELGKKVVKEKVKGILFCGSGTGMTIAANKVSGVRAVNANDKKSAKLSRLDNDANVLGLAGRGIDSTKAYDIAKTWLNTKFSGKERHKRRIKQIEEYEK